MGCGQSTMRHIHEPTERDDAIGGAKRDPARYSSSSAGDAAGAAPPSQILGPLEGEDSDPEEQTETDPQRLEGLKAIMDALGASEVLAKRIPATQSAGTGGLMSDLAGLTEDALCKAFQKAARVMARKIRRAVDAWESDAKRRAERNQREGTGGKFVEGKYGSFDMFRMGLDGLIGLPDVNALEAMKREHMSMDKFRPPNYKHIETSDSEEWARIVHVRNEQVVGVCNKDREGSVLPGAPDNLLEHPMARKAGLTLVELIALRLYTGPMFFKYNLVLRSLDQLAAEPKRKVQEAKAAKVQRRLTRRSSFVPGVSRYTTTIHAIASALTKVASSPPSYCCPYPCPYCTLPLFYQGGVVSLPHSCRYHLVFLVTAISERAFSFR